MFETLLQNIFYRFGTSILKFNSVLGFGFLFLAFWIFIVQFSLSQGKKEKKSGTKWIYFIFNQWSVLFFISFLFGFWTNFHEVFWKVGAEFRHQHG